MKRRTWKETSDYDLILCRQSYLNNDNKVTDPTGCMIIRELTDIDAELERRFGKLTPEQWREKEREIRKRFIENEFLSPEEIASAVSFFDKVMAEGDKFYGGKKLMPGQEEDDANR
jgi:hypothetical protein